MSTENITLWGKLAQKTTVYDSPYIKRPERGTPTETGHRVWLPRAGGRGAESNCLMGTGFQSSGDKRRQWLHSKVTVFNVTELHSLKWSQWLKNFCYVYVAII